MRKIQFGCGQCRIPEFENYDLDVDMNKPLPRDRFPDGSADVVFSEMGCEHLYPRDAWLFIEECHRILKPGGLLRIVVPDIVRGWRLKDPDWLRVNQGVTRNDGTLKDQYKSVLFGHNHLSLWSAEVLKTVFEVIGFQQVSIKDAGQSDHAELVDIEQHWRSVGRQVAWAESGCVEGVRP